MLPTLYITALDRKSLSYSLPEEFFLHYSQILLHIYAEYTLLV